MTCELLSLASRHLLALGLAPLPARTCCSGPSFLLPGCGHEPGPAFPFSREGVSAQGSLGGLVPWKHFLMPPEEPEINRSQALPPHSFSKCLYPYLVPDSAPRVYYWTLIASFLDDTC